MHPAHMALTQIANVMRSLRSPTGTATVTGPLGVFSASTYHHIQTRAEVKNPPEPVADPDELRRRLWLQPGQVLPEHEPAFGEVEEDLIGAAFVVAQAHLARENKKGADEAKQRVNHVANYFKHHMDWPQSNGTWIAPSKGARKPTFDALASLGIHGPGEPRLLTKLASWALTGNFDPKLLDVIPRWELNVEKLWETIS